MMRTAKQIAALKKANQESRQIVRESIQEGLFILMKKKPFAKITITELIKASGVSRSAFYNNYKSKSDILAEMIQDVTLNCFNSFVPGLKQGWRYTFHAVYEQRKKLEIVINAGLEAEILALMNQQILTQKQNYIIHAAWNGIAYNLVIEWVKRGMQPSIDEMVDYASAITNNPIFIKTLNEKDE
jgi:AcrR family transcriptional regulator